MKQLLTIAITCACLLLFSTGAHSIVVVEYDVANSNPSVSNVVSPMPAPLGVIPSTMVSTPATLLTPAPWTGSFTYTGWAASVALNPAQYYEFTVTPAVGYQVEYQSIDLAVQSGVNPDATFEIHASLDSFGTSDIALITQNFAALGAVHIFDGLDISALGTQSGAVTFRFYMYRPPGSQDGFTGLVASGVYGPDKNFFVNGIVTGPPVATEPTTWGHVKALYDVK